MSRRRRGDVASLLRNPAFMAFAVFWKLAVKLMDGLRFVSVRMEARRQKRIIDSGEFSSELPRARLATLEDLAEHDFLQQRAHSAFLGVKDERPIWHNGAHLVVNMGTRLGKTQTCLIPSVIAQGGRSSCIVFDPKMSEIAHTTGEGRCALDAIEPIHIAPWNPDKNTRINLLQDIVDLAAAGRPIKDRAVSKMHMIYELLLKDAKNNRWIVEFAKRMCEMHTCWLAHHDPGRCTLPELWELSTQTHELTLTMLEIYTESDAADGYVARIAMKLHEEFSHETEGRKVYNWVTNEIENALSSFGLGGDLYDATQASDVDVRELRVRPRAVYVCPPEKFVKSHSQYFRILFDFLIESVASRSGLAVTFFLEEFATLERIPAVESATRLYGSRDIHLVFSVQDREGFHAYPSKHKLFEENATCVFAGIEDGRHLADIERRAGFNTFSVQTASVNVGGRADSPTRGRALMKEAVLPASEVGKVGKGKAIIIAHGAPVALIDRVGWWEVDAFRPYVKSIFEHPLVPYEG